MTSGAIQHGVPTNVFLTLFRVTSPPVARNALTPKSKRKKEKKRSPLFDVRHYCLHILTLYTSLFLSSDDELFQTPWSPLWVTPRQLRHQPSYTLENAITGDGSASSPVQKLTISNYYILDQKGIKTPH